MQPERSPNDHWRGAVRSPSRWRSAPESGWACCRLSAGNRRCRDFIAHNEQRGINPGAKFYTELPCMPAIYDRVERARQR